MANQWLRLYAEFATDPKIQMLTESMQRRFVMLLCAKCNVSVTLHDDEIIFLLRITSEEWLATKAVFIAKNFIDNDNNIINWDKRQYRSDTSSERVAKHRQSKKDAIVTDVTSCNVSVTPPEQNRTDTEQIIVLVETSPKPQTKPKSNRGTRISADWELPVEWGEWALSLGMTRDAVLYQEEKFKDYWLGKSGANATKADWQATWRNWIRKHLEGYAK